MQKQKVLLLSLVLGFMACEKEFSLCRAITPAMKISARSKAIILLRLSMNSTSQLTANSPRYLQATVRILCRQYLHLAAQFIDRSGDDVQRRSRTDKRGDSRSAANRRIHSG